MRKIKSVKLAKDYLTASAYCPAGTVLIPNGDFWMAKDTNGNKIYRNLAFHISDILESTVGLFTIEYEPEGFELKPPTNCLEEEWRNIQLNKLADWCDGQNKKDLPREYFVEYDDIILLTDWTHDQYFRHGLKFNSCQSANLFITEINKPENSDYKKYFIELLKKTRL